MGREKNERKPDEPRQFMDSPSLKILKTDLDKT